MSRITARSSVILQGSHPALLDSKNRIALLRLWEPELTKILFANREMYVELCKTET